MTSIKVYFYVVLAACLGGALSLTGYKFMERDTARVVHTANAGTGVRYAGYTPGGTPADFTYAAEQTLPKVVHIKVSKKVREQAFSPFGGSQVPEEFRRFFFGPFEQPQGGSDGGQLKQEGTGSGVIISADGYIVTNNHVAAGADEMEVSLYDKRTFPAKLVGTDPSTDLALLKIEAKDLPFIQFTNSDDLRVGQWVVAVGNPFDLESTVTAGIVGAKGRSININTDRAPIEAFIQTDAAVNPGNSGGALVNLNGELVGINSAIASPTGTYAGYSFAVPANLAAKVVEDLRQYGVAQRAFLGAKVRTINGEFAREKNLDVHQGVWIEDVTPNSAAAKARLQKGDIITRVDDRAVSDAAALIERIGRHRPGDKVMLTYLRNNAENEVEVILKNANGNTDTVTKTTTPALGALGADFEPLTAGELERQGLSSGLRVTKLRDGKLRSAGVREGFILVNINNQPVSSTDDLQRILDEHNGSGILLEGKYPGQDEMQYIGFGN